MNLPEDHQASPFYINNRFLSNVVRIHPVKHKLKLFFFI